MVHVPRRAMLAALAAALAVLASCRREHPLPRNAGRCVGGDPVITYWRKRLGAMQYLDGNGKAHPVKPVLLPTSQKCVEAHCVQGVWDGEWNEWRSDGTASRKGLFQHGLRVGTWTRFDPDGGVLGSVAFDAGTAHWVDWFDDGTPAEEGDYVAGEQTGRWRRWRSDGGLAWEEDFFHGLRHGESIVYPADGGPRFNHYSFGNRVDAGTVEAEPATLPPPVPLEGCGP